MHGLRGRFSLSYDLTFLNILLCSLYEGETPTDSGIDRCPIHPVHGVLWRSADPTDYCADLSVALHYYNAQDKWQDDHNLLALGYSALLDNSTAEAALRWPRQCNAIRSCLAKLAEYEAAGSTDLDAVSGCFGTLMAELFDYRQDRTGRRSCAASASIWASSSTCWTPTMTCPATSAGARTTPCGS